MIPTLHPIVGLDQMAERDRDEITGLLGRLFAGFALRDSSLLDAVYAPDADWINAFGSRKKGAAAIMEYLDGLFADQNFRQGELTDVPICTLRRLDDAHAVVHAHLQVRGQGLVDGGRIALRNNHSLHVMSRQEDGRWRIVSELFMDVRDDHSYINHS